MAGGRLEKRSCNWFSLSPLIKLIVLVQRLSKQFRCALSSHVRGANDVNMQIWTCLIASNTKSWNIFIFLSYFIKNGKAHIPITWSSIIEMSEMYFWSGDKNRSRFSCFYIWISLVSSSIRCNFSVLPSLLLAPCSSLRFYAIFYCSFSLNYDSCAEPKTEWKIRVHARENKIKSTSCFFA